MLNNKRSGLSFTVGVPNVNLCVDIFINCVFCEGVGNSILISQANRSFLFTPKTEYILFRLPIHNKLKIFNCYFFAVMTVKRRTY